MYCQIAILVFFLGGIKLVTRQLVLLRITYCHSMKSVTDKKEIQYQLSTETIRAVSALGDVLLSIHKRLTSEGYIISDGIISKRDENKKS
jgi:hypothetical protein